MNTIPGFDGELADADAAVKIAEEVSSRTKDSPPNRRSLSQDLCAGLSELAAKLACIRRTRGGTQPAFHANGHGGERRTKPLACLSVHRRLGTPS